MRSDDSAGRGNEKTLDAHLELMDRQIVDVDGRMVAKVDDVELTQREDGRLVATALLTGPGALGPRIGGALGSVSTAIWSRLSGRAATDPERISADAVSEISTAIRLRVSRRTVNVDGFEVWVRDRVIAALPGAGKDPE
jgi:sporulation protein YlmC with PRC-barrel domain